MSRKKLIETLEVAVAFPDVNGDIAFDNMVSVWGSVSYPELSVLLVHLRHVSAVHQHGHWTTKGDPFYGDHKLFEKLYESTLEEIDALGEKAVGLGSIENVNLALQTDQMANLASLSGTSLTLPTQSDVVKSSLAAEVLFLRNANRCAMHLKEMGTLTRGLDNFLQGLEDQHESNVYLLKQRVGGTL